MNFEEACLGLTTEKISSAGYINFVHNWLIRVPRPQEEATFSSSIFGTTYKTGTCDWNVHIRPRNMFPLGPNGQRRNVANGSHILVESTRNTKFLKGTCRISFELFADDEMKIMMHSSGMMECRQMDTFMSEGLRFRTPQEGQVEQLTKALYQRTCRNAVIHVELNLSVNFFLRHFEECQAFYTKILPKFPTDLNSDFRFGFLKNGDCKVHCLDGDLPASRNALYLMSTHFRELLNSDSSMTVFPVEHNKDVVQPILWFLHSLCFELPTNIEITFVTRLVTCLDYIQPVCRQELLTAIHRALCEKLVENTDDFFVILELCAFACRQKFLELKSMSCSVIAAQFYERFKDLFAPGAPMAEDVRYRELTASVQFMGLSPSDLIERIHKNSFKTERMLP